MHQIKFLMAVFVLFGVFLNPLYAKSASKPALMLANIYHEGIDLDQYWVSEKYDGVRALWNGEKFVSRGGHTYKAPQWFIRDFPQQKLDGELWIGRQQFELLLSTVRDHEPDDEAWRKVKYMVFDMPDLIIEGKAVIFDERIHHIKNVVINANIDWLLAVKQWKVADHKTLMQELNEITKAGAEGLMLHRGASFYKGKRTGDLLKVKPYQDAEAIVIDHIPGKGKYTNMMGALLVETVVSEVTDVAKAEQQRQTAIRFKLGSGFSDEERLNPPQIGDIVTYRYRGKTKNGVPRFASFLRVRKVGDNKGFTK